MHSLRRLLGFVRPYRRLAALSLVGLGIFGPGIASGLVSGGPQLGAGAAIGTGLAVGGAAFAAGEHQ